MGRNGPIFCGYPDLQWPSYSGEHGGFGSTGLTADDFQQYTYAINVTSPNFCAREMCTRTGSRYISTPTLPALDPKKPTHGSRGPQPFTCWNIIAMQMAKYARASRFTDCCIRGLYKSLHGRDVCVHMCPYLRLLKPSSLSTMTLSSLTLRK